MFGTHRHARQNEETVTNVRSAFILCVPPLYADQGEYPFKPLVIKPGQHRLLWNWLLDLSKRPAMTGRLRVCYRG
jgi:hypothetical protein